jgi:hypothetical protein
MTATTIDHGFATVESGADVYVGTVTESKGTVRIDSGMRGRPVLLPVDDVDEILPVDSKNPHVESPA